MKNRLLSLLLLVAMLVTAVPLAAVAVLAADTELQADAPEFTEEDYNALYKQDGLLFWQDFFRLNSHWGTAAPTMPDAPADVFEGQKVVDTGDAPTAEYQAAITEYKGDAQAILDGFVVKAAASTALKIALPAINGKSWNDLDGSAQKVNFTFGAGYIQLSFVHNNSFLNFSGIPAGGSVTAEYVTTGGEQASYTNLSQFYLVRGLPLAVAINGDNVILTKFSEYGSISSAEADFDDVTLAGATKTPFTLAVQSTLAENGHDMVGNVWVNGDKKVTDVTVTMPTASSTSSIGYSSRSTQKIYAIRYYSTALSDAERAQNHFADIAKWYKLDLSYVNLLSGDELLPVYAAAADFIVDGDDGENGYRDAVAAVVEGAAKAAVEEKYAAIDSDVLAIAVAYGLEISPLVTFPKAMLTNTYAALATLASEDDPAAAYATALEADLASTLPAEDYNALYVQDQLVYAADFSSTNKYWSNTAAVQNLTATNAATFLNGYRWLGTRGFGSIAYGSGDTADITVRDGYLDLAPFYNLNLIGISTDANRGFGGATAEFVRTYTTGDVAGLFLGVRAQISADGTLSNLNFGNATPLTVLRPTGVKFADPSKAATYTTYIHQPQYNMNPGNTDLRTATVVYAELLEDRNGDGTPDVVIDTTNEVYTTPAHENSAGSGVIWSRQYPYKKIVPAYIKTAEGYTENTAKTEYYAAITPRFQEGEYAIYQNGETVYENDAFPYVNSPFYENDNYLALWGQSGSTSSGNSGKVYFLRYYNKQLSADEMAQNHFADLAKFFRLNLFGLDLLPASALPAVYAAVADFTVESDRLDVQTALTVAINEGVKPAYEAMKVAGDAAQNAFVDFAADYYLNINEIVASKRDMSSVYAREYTGADAAAMQAAVDEAYLDAYHYLSYQRAGEDEWNEMMQWCADHAYMDGADRVDLEPLNALPFAIRKEILAKTIELKEAMSIAAAQAIIDAFVEEKMAAYAVEEFDYNTLYAGLDAVLYAIDFFKLNKYWGEEVVLPTLPQELTAYEFNGKTYDFTDPANRLVPADKPYAVQRAAGNFWTLKADGGFTFTTEPRTTFATEPEAQAFADAVAAAGGSPVAGVVKLGYYIVERFRLNTAGERDGSYDNYDTAGAFNGATSMRFATLEEASAKAQELAGEGAVQQADGSWRSVVADSSGKLRDYQPMWEPIPNDAYQSALDAYCAEIRALLESFSIISKDDQKMSLLQYLPVIGPRGHHSLDGAIQTSGLEAGEGFLIHNFVSSNSYFTTSSVPASGTLFADILVAGGAGNATSSGGLFTIRDAQYNVTVDDNGTHLKGTAGYQGFPTVSFQHTVADRFAPFHFTVSSVIEGESHAIDVGVNGTSVHSGTYTDKNSGYTMLGYGQSRAATPEYYAIRFFSRALTADEQLANRFADVAKFYRLEMNGYMMLSASEKRAAQEALAAIPLGSLERDEVQAMLDAAVVAHYDGLSLVADTEKNEAFLELAVIGALDLAAIENLDASGRETIVDAMLETFDLNYATNGAVIAATYAKMTEELAILTFEGYQVRLDSGSALANYAGVRAVYKVNLDKIEAICKDEDMEVGLSVNVTVGGTAAATLNFLFTWDSEAEELKVEGENKVGENDPVPADLVVEEIDGKKIGTFYYTVTYKGESFTEANLAKEFGYTYAIGIGADILAADYDRGYEFTVVSQNFGETVTASEVYGYFYNHGYAEDAVVKSVYDLLAAGD